MNDTTHRQSRSGLAFAALMGGNIMLAFGPWMVRLADVGALSSAFWRVALALPLLFLAARVTRQPFRRDKKLVTLLLVGGAFFALDLATWHSGILLTKLANATLFGNVSSFIFAAYGFFLARHLPGRTQTIALILAALGVAMLLGRSYELSPRHFLGDLLCILAGILYTGYLIAVERARNASASWPALAVSTTGAVPVLLIIALAMGEKILPQNWTPLILLALGSQVIGQGLMVYALGHLSPVIVGVALLTQPVVAAVIGWTAYDERLDLLDFVGMAAVALALILIRRSDRPHQAATG